MDLQSSGAISIADIAAEFGGTAPHTLSEYYRGGAYVPDSAANAGIPTSGAIKLSDFYGAMDALLYSTSLTAGTNAPTTPTSTGFSASPSYGSLGDVNFFNSNECLDIFSFNTSNDVYVRFAGFHAQSVFTTIAVPGVGTLNSADASSYSVLGSSPNFYGQWIWSGAGDVTSGTVTVTVI